MYYDVMAGMEVIREKMYEEATVSDEPHDGMMIPLLKFNL